MKKEKNDKNKKPELINRLIKKANYKEIYNYSQLKKGYKITNNDNEEIK